MTLHFEKTTRRDQTQRELRRLHQEIERWLDRTISDDLGGLHKSKLETIRATLIDAANDLDTHLRSLDLDQPLDALYAECRDYDKAIIWLRRMWDFIREKFDQRVDPRFRQLLMAADEVAWSCYRQVYLMAAQRDRTLPPPPPPPLVFLAAEYSPGAVQSDRPLPPSLKLSASADFSFLNEYLQTLPVPLVRLPHWCVDAPWWLVYIGHEIGHHIQHDLNLVNFFEEGLSQVVTTSPSTNDVAELSPVAEAWESWSEEIFADIFSVIMLGSWAVWAMVEAERSTPMQMISYKSKYPPPVIRLALMARTADQLGMNGTSALGDLDLQAIAGQSRRTTRDLGLVEAVVTFALGNLRDNLGTLSSLCGMGSSGDPAHDRKLVQNGEAIVRRIGQLLLAESALGLEKGDLTSARRITTGSLAAWAIIRALPSEIRDVKRDVLAAQTIAQLIEHAPPGTRPASIIHHHTDLADFLINRSRQSTDTEKIDREGRDAVSN